MRVESCLLPDPYGRAHRNPFEEVNDLCIPHANAAVAAALADASLVIGAVDVNKAIISIRIFWLSPSKPENAGEHQVLGLGA